MTNEMRTVTIINMNTTHNGVTMHPADAAEMVLVDNEVVYSVNGKAVVQGFAVYVTEDLWVGIRSADGGLDETPLALTRLA